MVDRVARYVRLAAGGQPPTPEGINPRQCAAVQNHRQKVTAAAAADRRRMIRLCATADAVTVIRRWQRQIRVMTARVWREQRQNVYQERRTHIYFAGKKYGRNTRGKAIRDACDFGIMAAVQRAVYGVSDMELPVGAVVQQKRRKR